MTVSTQKQKPVPRADTDGLAVESLVSLMQMMRALPTTDRPWLELDLTMTQLKALMIVVQTGGVPSRGLAGRLSISASAVTPLVDRLAEQKLVRREDDPSDRRVVIIRPTAHALALRQKLLATTRAVAADVLNEVQPSKLFQVQQALALLASAAARLVARTQEMKPRT